jgi:predicted DNA-binding protein
MSTKTHSKTKTISLRIPVEFDDYLEKQSLKTSRSKSNYIKLLIQEKMSEENQFWQQQIDKARKIGSQALKDNGLQPDKMSSDDVYNFFKGL